MSEMAVQQEMPIAGWRAIAAAVSKATGASACIRTAQRYARPGRRNRLPVYKWDNGVVYMKPSGLALWKEARGIPLGGREPGR